MCVCALEVFHEDFFEVRPTLDSVGRKVFQPRSRRIGQEQWNVADNECNTLKFEFLEMDLKRFNLKFLVHMKYRKIKNFH